MVKYNMSQLKSKIRQIESRQRQTISKLNHAISNYNRDVNKSINAYNQAVRKHNSLVRKNRQIVQREIAKLNSYHTKTKLVATVSSMQTYYNRIIVSYHGVDVTPETDRILELVENENANSVITTNLLENDVFPIENTEDIEIGDKLKLVSIDLNDRWQGALFSLNPKNPDATRHFCTSVREIFANFIEIKAPDTDVFAYNPDCEVTKNGNPTRREKIKYMMRNKIRDDNVVAFADADIENILELNFILSGGTHGEAGKYSFEKLMQVKKRVESGINFLCEISA